MPLNANPPAVEQDAPAPTRPQSNVQPNRNVASLGPTPPAQQQPQTTAATGNYIVQVASHKTPEEAQAAWQGLKTQHASIFGTRNADIRKVDLGDRGTFYRAMVGPMNRDQANALCQNLKTAGAGCIVQTRN
jgi:cell division septation protein DedD